MAAGLKRVHQIAQRTVNLDRAVAFYRDTLGLTLIARFDPPGLAFFDLGNTRLLLENGASSVVLYIEVDDIDTIAPRRGRAVRRRAPPDPPRCRWPLRTAGWRRVDGLLQRLRGEPPGARRATRPGLIRRADICVVPHVFERHHLDAEAR